VPISPDQVAAFWHKWDHVVETAGTAAIAGDIAEGSHKVVLKEVSNDMILLRRALVNCPEPNGKCRPPETQTASKRGPIRIWIQDSLHIYFVHDMF
jgi:hypothetical protein